MPPQTGKTTRDEPERDSSDDIVQRDNTDRSHYFVLMGIVVLAIGALLVVTRCVNGDLSRW